MRDGGRSLASLLLMMRASVSALMGCLVASGCTPPASTPGLVRVASVYEDLGAAPADEPLRVVMALAVRDRPGLDVLARDLYDPRSPHFRHYLEADAVAARFLPTTDAVESARAWATRHGLRVTFVAGNRLLLEITGTAGRLDEALSTTVHAYRHRSRDQRVFGTPGGVVLPEDVAFEGIVALDQVATGTAGAERAAPEVGAPPAGIGYAPTQIARAYGTDTLGATTGGGHGATIALAVGGGFGAADARAFWKATKVERAPAVVREVSGPPSFRGLEGTMMVEWAGALAPGSELVVYQGQDSRSASTLLAFDEAIADGRADVVAFSHSRHESSEPALTREVFDLAAELGAVAGVTVVAASGDTAKPDVPATCPFVTAVGGTMLVSESSGESEGTPHEEAWGRSGSGISDFEVPHWQAALAGASGAKGRRVTPDLAVNAGIPYLVLHEGEWRPAGGSSIGAPVFAGVVALVDAERRSRGRPRVGFLNPALYEDTRVQQSFRDIVVGGTREHAAGTGWDFPTGWGAPRARALADALP